MLAVDGRRPGGVLVSPMFLLQSGDWGRGLPADLKTHDILLSPTGDLFSVTEGHSGPLWVSRG